MRGARLISTLLFIALVVLGGCSRSTSDRDSRSFEGTPAGFLAFDTPPVLTYFMDPQYPPAASEIGLEGMVRVKILVGLDGEVEDVSVMSSTNAIFHEAALSAAQKFRFRPAELRGAPTKAHVLVPVHFRLDA